MQQAAGKLVNKSCCRPCNSEEDYCSKLSGLDVRLGDQATTVWHIGVVYTQGQELVRHFAQDQDLQEAALVLRTCKLGVGSAASIHSCTLHLH